MRNVMQRGSRRGAGAGSYRIAARATIGARAGGRRRRAPRRATALALLLAAGAGGGCATTPIVGGSSLIPFPKSYDVELGQQALSQYVDPSKVVSKGKDAEMVSRIMQRLVAAAGADANGYDFSVRLVEDPKTVNAFALPGGPMAVYTGILPVTQTEAGLAVVMGHEIGHVLARHGMQRMVRDQGAQLLLQMFDLGDWTQLVQLGYQYGVSLPFSRGDESQADHIGLILMARAGYDPQEAVSFWERMSKMSPGSGPEWLSTHPSHGTRVQQLQGWLPEAEKEYAAAGSGS